MMDQDHLRIAVIEILEEALKKYAQKENWSKSHSSGDNDQFALRGNGFETAQEAIDKCIEIVEDWKSKNQNDSGKSDEKKMMNQMYNQHKNTYKAKMATRSSAYAAAVKKYTYGI